VIRVHFTIMSLTCQEKNTIFLNKLIFLKIDKNYKFQQLSRLINKAFICLYLLYSKYIN